MGLHGVPKEIQAKILAELGVDDLIVCQEVSKYPYFRCAVLHVLLHCRHRCVDYGKRLSKTRAPSNT